MELQTLKTSNKPKTGFQFLTILKQASQLHPQGCIFFCNFYLRGWEFCNLCFFKPAILQFLTSFSTLQLLQLLVQLFRCSCNNPTSLWGAFFLTPWLGVLQFWFIQNFNLLLPTPVLHHSNNKVLCAIYPIKFSKFNTFL